MKPESGTYALILLSHSTAKVQIGRWREIDLIPGYYIYVGSAFGPGGVQARVSRHYRKKKSLHWHIDYLTHILSPWGAWYSHDTKRLEHTWATFFSDMRETSSVPGFGCSDCSCSSHLFQSSEQPDFARFTQLAKDQVETWSFEQLSE